MFFNKSLFIKRLRKLRLERKLTQEKLATMLNVSRGAISHWEVGDRSPSLDIINALAKSLNCTPAYLLGFTGKRNPLDEHTHTVDNFFLMSDIPMYLSNYDSEGNPRFMEVNNAVLRILGYSREEFLNLDPRMLCERVYLSKLSKNIDVVNQCNKLIVGWVHVTKDGKRLPVELNIYKFCFDDNEAYLTIALYH
ncbi:helix-turn-helix domain-containing protein [Desulforamulus aquiferis]|uniref:Helix-turn-helix domain-containing protein n=1 Tax=Desulforamulus aquiferis TaxID=1397668 RepID=A0AAW7ZB73_9FIRM|nr:helix-turn-helix domain-containing protein [Desulforamulus aquiferis]MDO7786596.1 helix-turn-helix domain-containing protein [Desulforamulus aquiferis]RYD05627.1 repressor protein [Desulforamulus aquiferis]